MGCAIFACFYKSIGIFNDWNWNSNPTQKNSCIYFVVLFCSFLSLIWVADGYGLKLDSHARLWISNVVEVRLTGTNCVFVCAVAFWFDLSRNVVQTTNRIGTWEVHHPVSPVPQIPVYMSDVMVRILRIHAASEMGDPAMVFVLWLCSFEPGARVVCGCVRAPREPLKWSCVLCTQHGCPVLAFVQIHRTHLNTKFFRSTTCKLANLWRSNIAIECARSH